PSTEELTRYSSSLRFDRLTVVRVYSWLWKQNVKNQPRNTLMADPEPQPESVLTRRRRRSFAKLAQSLSENTNGTTFDVTKTRRKSTTDVTAKSTMSI